MTHDIRSVAVLGAGTMGAAIAAHAANAGLAVDLLDLDQEATQGGFDRMLAARPAALASPRLAERIRLGTFEEDLDRVGDADWVVEAIVERLEPKQELLARVEKLVDPDAVVTSNTSGLPLASLAEGRSEAFRRRFLGTHFFNPPRYLKLVELIPTADTDPEVLERMRAFVERVLGKGAVVAKDTPNFIANRLGSFAGMHDVRYALEHGYSTEEVDALTGPLVGRPRTATFRLFDQVGLDVMVGVAANLYDLAPEDESRDVLPAPQPLRRMLDAKLLGNKTGGGFYRRGKRDGQTVFDVLDLDTLEYRPAARPDLPIVAAARDHDDLGARLGFLLDKAEEDRGARYLRDTLLPSLAYAARRVPEIADSLVEVDHAVEWGFGYELGPFQAWDAIGVADGVARMEALGIEVPAWVKEMLAAGHQSFYRDGQVYSPLLGAYQPVPADQEVIDLDRLKAEGAEVAGNGSASLVDLGDGVLCLELHAPASAIDAAVVELGARAAKELEGGDWKGLVIASQARNFCVGANLGEVGMAAYQGLYDQVGEAAKGLQDTLMSLRYAPRPVVAAPHGQTLGGGAEIVLAADRVVAALETYIGLVEVGVGIVPAGGGCKELLRRVVSPAMRAAPDAPPLPFVQRVFETIGLAKVATSAVEARELGFLEEHDVVVLNPDHQLAAAKREVLDLADSYVPLAREASVYAAGLPVLAALEMGVQTLQWAGQ
ncbi:MAG: 3-hydroxyacyl-CoA dehydrogenase/enoyl-CoA hydratase family protein, partial [Actinomycetes bacterium]